MLMSPSESHSHDPLQKLEATLGGKWFVVASNFPMWLDAKNTNPAFTYSDFRMEKNELLFDDLVTYKKDGKEKKIKGTDHQEGDQPKFVWKGKGLLGLVRSKWQVLATDPKGQWLVISFEKTLATPAGVDLLSRQQRMAEKEIKSILALIDPKLSKKRMIQLLR